MLRIPEAKVLRMPPVSFARPHHRHTTGSQECAQVLRGTSTSLPATPDPAIPAQPLLSCALASSITLAHPLTTPPLLTQRCSDAFEVQVQASASRPLHRLCFPSIPAILALHAYPFSPAAV